MGLLFSECGCLKAMHLFYPISAPSHRDASQLTWLEHPQRAQGSSSTLARIGHLERLLLASSTRFKSLGGVVLLGGVARFVEQNLEMTPGRPPA